MNTITLCTRRYRITDWPTNVNGNGQNLIVFFRRSYARAGTWDKTVANTRALARISHTCTRIWSKLWWKKLQYRTIRQWPASLQHMCTYKEYHLLYIEVQFPVEIRITHATGMYVWKAGETGRQSRPSLHTALVGNATLNRPNGMNNYVIKIRQYLAQDGYYIHIILHCNIL